MSIHLHWAEHSWVAEELWLQLTTFFYIVTKMRKEFQPRILIALKLYGILLLSSVQLDLTQRVRPDGASTGIQPEHPGHYLELAATSMCIWLVWNTHDQASELKTTREIRMKSGRENIMQIQNTLVWLWFVWL